MKYFKKNIATDSTNEIKNILVNYNQNKFFSIVVLKILILILLIKFVFILIIRCLTITEDMTMAVATTQGITVDTVMITMNIIKPLFSSLFIPTRPLFVYLVYRGSYSKSIIIIIVLDFPIVTILYSSLLSQSNNNTHFRHCNTVLFDN